MIPMDFSAERKQSAASPLLVRVSESKRVRV
jgi:hypothetical protein